MNTHSSASVRVETPHETNNDLKRRAQAVINDTSIDPQWRNIVRYALEIHDPLLPDLVRRADAGDRIIDNTDCSQTPEIDEDHSTREKLEALVDIICGAGGATAAGGLFVLMGVLQNSTEVEIVAGLLYLYNVGYNHWLYNPMLYQLWKYQDLTSARILAYRLYCLIIAAACLALAHLLFERRST